jgi:hypothetical protein
MKIEEQTRNVIVVGLLTERIKKKKPTRAKKKNHPPTRHRRLSSWDTDWDYILDRVVP